MNEEELKSAVKHRMESSFSSLIQRGEIPEGCGLALEKMVYESECKWIDPIPFPASTVYQFSAQQRTLLLGDGSDAPSIIERSIREKDIEEYKKLCQKVEIDGELRSVMDECEARIIRDGGGDGPFFWMMCDDGTAILYHPCVMKRLNLKGEDWFGKFRFHDGEWIVSLTAAYQPRQPNYGIVLVQKKTES